MRLFGLPLLLFASICLSACTAASQPREAPAKLTTGFWFWRGGSVDAKWSGESLDVLFVHVGTLRRETKSWGHLVGRREPAQGPWDAHGWLPDELPAARDYWLVFRYDRQSLPDSHAAPVLANEVDRLLDAARSRNLHVAGVQLDIDSPTRALPQYAGFLREFRKQLPPGLELSITALLDWFRDGTAIADVLQEVDEFVPQFYDVADPDEYLGGSAIAANIDAARWGPVFNRYGKRFRLGISTFGRAGFVRERHPSRFPHLGFGVFYRDLKPLDIATNPAFRLQATRNGANELVLSYRVTRRTSLGYNDFESGDTIQFVLATPESVQAAIKSAKSMGGHLAGVLFFRWPSSNEALVLQPDEVLAAAGVLSGDEGTGQNIHAIDGGCAAVSCVDLYFEGVTPFAPKPLRHSIRSSLELEYFLPEENIPVRMVGPSELELSLPPYCGRGILYIGRAVTANPSDFTVSEEQ